MFSISSRLQTVLSVILSFVIATGLWYLVVGRDHVETQVELRVEYRGLPDGLVIREGMVNHISVRLRGSAELLRNLHSRDLVYTVDLSRVQKGASALPLAVDSIPDFKAFEIMEILPNRLVLEADALTERVVQLENKPLPLPADSPYIISQIILEPSFVTVKGPETQINTIDKLIVIYDPTKNTSEGPHEANVAIAAPSQVEVTPPVTTLRYTLNLKTQEVTLNCPIQLDSEIEGYGIEPVMAKVTLSVPESLADDRDYLETVRVIVRRPTNLTNEESIDITPLVMLPSGAKLTSIEPQRTRLFHRAEPDADDSDWTPAESIFFMPSTTFGMHLPDQQITGNFSLNDINIPTVSLPQPNDLKAPPVLSGEAPLPHEVPTISKSPTEIIAPQPDAEPTSSADPSKNEPQQIQDESHV